jgi:hypothetical protein
MNEEQSLLQRIKHAQNQAPHALKRGDVSILEIFKKSNQQFLNKRNAKIISKLSIK